MNTSGHGPAEEAAATQILMTAIGHIESGRYDDAKAALNAQNGLALKTPIGHNVLGDIHLKSGRPRDALKAFDRALKLAPTLPEAHCNRAVALQEMGRLDEALRAADRALRYRPGYPMASFNRGNILRDKERFDDALTAYDLALSTRPDFAEALINRGTTQLDLKQPMLALADFRAVLLRAPKTVAAMVGRALAQRQLGQTDDAMASLVQALGVDPHDAEALLLQNDLLVTVENFERALEPTETLVAAHPDDVAAHRAHGSTLARLGRFDEALAAYDRAIELSPREPMAHIMRSLALGEIGRFDEQWKALRQAEKLGATGASVHHSRAQVMVERGNLDAAITSYRKAIDLDPERYETHLNYSFLCLMLGRFGEAWPEHEWRLKKYDHPWFDYRGLAPKWQGENLTGRKLLIYCEQGHGDTIQFLRFLSPLVESGAEITFLAPGALLGVLRENLSGIDIAEKIGLRRDFDFQIPLMSLPNVFGTTIDGLPGIFPEVKPNPGYAAKWAERLGEEGFKVGIVWQGNPDYGADRHRSIPLANYAPLGRLPGVRLISLQVFHGLDQLDDLPAGMEVERLGEEITNNPSGYREVTAVMANLDLIITSDTGPAHLAGTMGCPVWVALRDRPDWRWLLERADSPWYPTMRLFRQEKRGAWGPLFEEIASALADRIAVSGGSGASR